MQDFKKMYFELAGKVADAIDLLIAAQQRAEDMYIESECKPTEATISYNKNLFNNPE